MMAEMQNLLKYEKKMMGCCSLVDRIFITCCAVVNRSPCIFIRFFLYLH
jgi:hypothetical protein